MSLPASSFNTDNTANKLRQTYVQGYVDLSGGDLNIQNGNLNMYNGSTQVNFRVADDHFTVRSYPSGQAVDVSLSQLIFLNTISGNVDNTFSVINQKISGITYDGTFDRTFIDNDLSLSGNLSVGKKSYFLGDVSMTKNLFIGGNTYINDVSFAGNTMFTLRAPTYIGADAPTANTLIKKSYVDSVFTASDITWTGINTFNRFPVYSGGSVDPSQNFQFATKKYVDSNTGTLLLPANNVWTGNNAFSNYFPYWSGAGGPTQGNQFVTKAYVDSNGGVSILGSNNIWTGDNSFSKFPSYSGVGLPTLGNQFATKAYVDNNAGSQLLSTNNIWTGDNSFSKYPSYSGSASLTQGNQFATKAYVDSNGGTQLLASNNIWTGDNSFSKYPSYSGSASLTQGNQFATKAYVDSNGGTQLLVSNNIWTGDNSFSKYPSYSGAGVPTLGNQFTTKAYVDSNGGTQLLSANNIWTGDNSFSKYPSYSGSASLTQGNQFATKAYVDSNGGTQLLGSNNIWTGDNSFSKFPSYSGAGVPTLGNQFTTKAYVDSNGGTQLLGLNNAWTGNNYFAGDVSINSNVFINRDLSLNRYLRVGADVSLGANLFVLRDVSMASNLTVANKVGIGRVAGATYSLDVTGNVNLTGNLFIGGSAFTSTDLSLNARLSVGSDASFVGNVFLGKTLNYRRQSTAAGGSSGAPVAITATTSLLELSGADGTNYFTLAAGSYNGQTLHCVSIASGSQGLYLNGAFEVNGADCAQIRFSAIKQSLYLIWNSGLNGWIVGSWQGVNFSGASLNFGTYTTGDINFSSANRTFVSSGILQVAQNSLLDGNLFVVKDVSMSSKLFVSGDTSMNGNLSVGSNVFVNGPAYLSNRAFIANDVSMGARLFVVGDASMSNKLFVNGDTSMNGNLSVGSNVFVNGPSYLNNRAFITNDVSMGSRLFVVGDASMSNKLFVSGDTSMNGNLSVGSNVFVNGPSYLNNRAFITNDVSMGSRLFVIGDSSLSGKLFVNGDVSFNGNLRGVALNADGNLVVNGNARFAKDVSMGANLIVLADLSLNGNLRVGRDISLGGNLYCANSIAIGSTIPTGKLHVYESIGVGAGPSGLGSIIVEHANSGGNSSVVFPSSYFKTTEYGYIQYTDSLVSKQLTMSAYNYAMDLSYGVAALGAPIFIANGTTITNNGSSGGNFTAVVGNTADCSLAWIADPDTNINKYTNSLWFKQTNIQGKYISYISNGSSITTYNSFSFSAWIYPLTLPDAGTWHNIFNCLTPSSNFYLSVCIAIDQNKKIVFHINLTSANLGGSTNYKISKTVLQINRWYHVCCTYNGAGNGNIYINGFNDNGVDAGTGFTGQTAINAYNRINIGASNALPLGDFGMFGFNGYMNQFIFTNSVFDSNTVLNLLMSSQLLQMGSNTSAQSLVSMNGFVGINTKTPAYQLDVIGSLNVSSNVLINGTPIMPFNNNTDLSLNANLSVGKDISGVGNFYLSNRAFIINDVSMGSRLFVGGDASMSSKLFVSGDTSMNGNLSVAKDISGVGNFYLSNRAFIKNDVSMGARLFVLGDTSLSGKLFASGDVSFNGNLSVGSNVFVNGPSYLYNRAFIANDVSMGARLFVIGDSSLSGKLFVGGDVSFNGNLRGLAINSDGNLAVNGNARFAKDVSMAANLFVGLDSSFNGKLFVGGDASFGSNFYINNNCYVANSMAVGKNTIGSTYTLDVNGNINLSGNIYQNGVLFSGGSGSFTGNLGIGITPALAKLHIYESVGSSAGATTGTILLEHGDLAGSSSLVFRSVGDNSGNEFGYLQYRDRGSMPMSDYAYDLSAGSGAIANLGLIANRGTFGGFLSASVVNTPTDCSLTWFANPQTNPYTNITLPSTVLQFGQSNLTTVSTANIAALSQTIAKTSNSLSFSLWIRPYTILVGSCLFSVFGLYNSGVSVVELIIFSNNLYVYTNNNRSNNYIYYTTSLAINTWYHVAYTFGGGVGTLYINGVSSGTLSGTPATTLNNFNSMFIGARAGYLTGAIDGAVYQKGFHGLITGVTLNDYALSAAEVATLYNNRPANAVLTLGIENDATGVGQDSIVLWPDAGTGFVGVNNMQPLYPLDVSGTLNLKGNLLVNNGSFTASMVNANVSSYSALSNFPYNGILNLVSGRSTVALTDRVPMIAFEQYGASGIAWDQAATMTIGASPLINQGTALEFVLSYANGSGPYDHARVLSLLSDSATTGRVGINNTAPSYALDVSGVTNVKSNTGTVLRLQNNTTVYNGGNVGIEAWTASANCPLGSIIATDNSVGPGGTYYSSMSFKININSTTSAGLYEAITIKANTSLGVSNVGINNTAPSTALHVTGVATATSFNATSDYRIKSDLLPIYAGVDKLNPVSFYNKDLGKRDIGFIAHEVQTVFPELVNGEKDGEQMQTLNYIGLIGVLTKEIKDLKQELNTTKQELNYLVAKLSDKGLI